MSRLIAFSPDPERICIRKRCLGAGLNTRIRLIATRYDPPSPTDVVERPQGRRPAHPHQPSSRGAVRAMVPMVGPNAWIVFAPMGATAGLWCGASRLGCGRRDRVALNGTSALFLSFPVLAASAPFGERGSAPAGFGDALTGYRTGFPAEATRVADAESALSAGRAEWTIFYWAWRIACAPFVALWLARVSRGRSVPAFGVGRLPVPATRRIGPARIAAGGGVRTNRGRNPAPAGEALWPDVFARLPPPCPAGRAIWRSAPERRPGRPW